MKHHPIKSDRELENLLKNIGTQRFIDSFVFDTQEMRASFLQRALPKGYNFDKKRYYYDSETKLHIAESADGFFWISTMGLFPTTKYCENSFVNAFAYQYTVVNALLIEADMLLSTERIYQLDSWENERIKILSPAIWHNITLLFEMFGKAYLSLSGEQVHHTHHISKITAHMKQTIRRLNQEDTAFCKFAVPQFETLSNHINQIPGEFNEAFIKYDANEEDSTCFDFSRETIGAMLRVSALFDELIHAYYSRNDSLYFMQGWTDKSNIDRIIEGLPDEFKEKWDKLNHLWSK